MCLRIERAICGARTVYCLDTFKKQAEPKTPRAKRVESGLNWEEKQSEKTTGAVANSDMDQASFYLRRRPEAERPLFVANHKCK